MKIFIIIAFALSSLYCQNVMIFSGGNNAGSGGGGTPEPPPTPSDYYITYNDVDDLDATNDTLTWSVMQTISLEGGKSYAFEKGKTYKDTTCWRISRSGTDTNRIVITSYGTGLKPIITSRYLIPNSNNTNAWSASGYTNVWRLTYSLPSGYSEAYFNISRMWLDDVEYGEANGLTGDNGDGTTGVNSINRFYHSSGSHRFYVYATSNPATFYSTIESLSPPYHKSDVTACIQSPYITIDGLDFRGGEYACLGAVNANHSWIINCNIGQDAGWLALCASRMNTWGVFGEVSRARSDSMLIAHDTIDSGFRLWRTWYDNGTENGRGLHLSDSTYYFDVYDNYVKDWMMGISMEGGGFYHKIHDNELTNPDGSYGKPIQVGRNGVPPDSSTQVKIYRNYMHDCRQPLDVGSWDNYIFYNVVENMDNVPPEGQQLNGHASANSMGVYYYAPQFDWGWSTAAHNYIFNNTFIDISDIMTNAMHVANYYYNNLFIDYDQKQADPDYRVLTWSEGWNLTSIYQRNILYVPSQTASSYVMWKSPSTYWTFTEFNAYGSNANNSQHTGALSALITASGDVGVDKYSIPAGSPALNISDTTATLRLILNSVSDSNGDFFDLNGNQILDNHDWYNAEKPHIGAIKN